MLPTPPVKDGDHQGHKEKDTERFELVSFFLFQIYFRQAFTYFPDGVHCTVINFHTQFWFVPVSKTRIPQLGSTLSAKRYPS